MVEKSVRNSGTTLIVFEPKKCSCPQREPAGMPRVAARVGVRKVTAQIWGTPVAEPARIPG